VSSLPVEHHPLLGRVTRTGPLSDQAVSTHRLIDAALADGRDTDAAELARYSVIEMAEVFTLFPGFFDTARRFLISGGLPEADLAAAEEHLDGRASSSGTDPPDLAGSWRAYEAAAAAFATSCEAGRGAGALAAFRTALSQWRRAHDGGCNRVYLYADLCAQRLGEDRVGDFWDELMADFYPTRDRFDVDRAPWGESVEVLSIDTAETFRGHLSGPDRLGDIEIIDEPGRTVFRFSPCGTGGRTFTGSPNDDGTSLEVPMDDPDRFGVTTRPHDWSWGKAGVCLYCVHCCQLQERVPMRRFGYPLRVIEPPVWPESRGVGRCTWTIYKDLSQIPAEAYERVGETKPTAPGSAARKGAAGGL
jgi:hypothetical protein